MTHHLPLRPLAGSGAEASVLHAHARIDALQNEVAYALAKLFAAQDPSKDTAEHLADLVKTFKLADMYAKPPG